MASSSFGELKILKVIPGQTTRYITEGQTIHASTSVGRPSLGAYRENSIPAVFRMYLLQMKISKLCMTYVRQQLTKDIYLTLKWIMFDFEDMVTSPEKLEQNKAKFEFTIKYNLDVEENFLIKVAENPITFRLHASCNENELFLSEAQFFISDIVDVVNVKQQQRVYFTSNVIDPSGEIIAYLDIWYKFSCKQKTLKTLFPSSVVERKKKKSTKMLEMLGEQFSKRSENFGTVYVTESEFDSFADSMLLVLNRNKVLKTTQSDINTELQERVRWLRFEANWKQTLQENAILHGKNPEDVVWRQWREEDTANVRLRTYDDVLPKEYAPELSVTIVDLYFLEGCPLLRNDEIKQFYVEYSFLGREGPQMETPFSVAKGAAKEKVVFNFKKTFPIDIKKNYKNCHNLAKLIKTDDIIKFTVISEPVVDLEYPIQTCQEVGFAELPFNELIQLQENVDAFEYEIVDINNPIAVLGYITLKVEGILAMRKMTLHFMAPKGYSLYVK